MKYIKILIIMTFFNVTGDSQIENRKSSIYDIQLIGIGGEEMNLRQYKGKKILFVNVASKCGFTKQYEGLQQLYDKYKEKLVIIGIPCNQFGEQEPGTNKEIVTFCKLNYGVDFPMAQKIDVKGKNQHPFYAWLTRKENNEVKNSSVKWNFQKYLIDENGSLIDYYFSLTKPMSRKITKHLE